MSNKLFLQAYRILRKQYGLKLTKLLRSYINIETPRKKLELIYPKKICLLLNSYLKRKIYLGNIPEIPIYDSEDKGKNTYLEIMTIFKNYISLNIKIKLKGKKVKKDVTNIDSINYLIFRLKDMLKKTKADTTLILGRIGIFNLPPSIECLKYISSLFETKNITTVIDYYPNTGLISSIISRFCNNITVYTANSNLTETKKPIVFYENVIEKNGMFNNKSLVLLLFFPDQLIHKILEKFKGDYIIYQGDSAALDEKLILTTINKKWKIIKTFDSIQDLSTIENRGLLKIHIMERRIKK